MLLPSCFRHSNQLSSDVTAGYEYHLLHIRPSVTDFPVPYPFPHAAALAQHHEKSRLDDRVRQAILVTMDKYIDVAAVMWRWV